MSGEFAVKINEVIQESLSDFFSNWSQAKAQANWSKGGAKQWHAAQRAKEKQDQEQHQAQQAQQQTPQGQTTAGGTVSRLGPGWKDTSLGISIKPATQKDPTFAYYQKKYYILDNLGRWLTSNKRPVPDTLSALLNQALEQT